MRDLGWKFQCQPWPLALIYSHCRIIFNISSENNDFGFISFQEINFSKNVPSKCIRKQIWPWRKVGQGQPRNIFEQTWLVPHPKRYIPRPKVIGFLILEKQFLRGFTIYRHSGHLGHVTWTIWTNFRSRILRSLWNLSLIGPLISKKMFDDLSRWSRQTRRATFIDPVPSRCVTVAEIVTAVSVNVALNS